MASVSYRPLRYEESVYFHQDKIRLNQCDKNRQIAHKAAFQEAQT
jgi:hypothetical protein